MQRPRTTSNTAIAALTLGLIAPLSIATTQRHYGLTIDEATYIWAARQSRDWCHELLSPRSSDALTAAGIDKYWHFLEAAPAAGQDHWNFNLPMAVHCMNAGWGIGHRWLAERTAYRLAMLALFSITVTATVSEIGRQRSTLAGIVAGSALVLSPRIWGHAHLAATETPLCCFWLLALLAIGGLAQPNTTDSDKTPWGRIAFGAFATAAACATKLTAWILPVLLVLWLLLYRPRGWRKTLVALALVVPLFVILATPNTWHDPIGRIGGYLADAQQQRWPIATYFLGAGYAGNPPPYSGVLLLLLTTPLAWLLLAGISGVNGVRNLRQQPFCVLILLNLLAVMTARTLGVLPGHDVERQFLPALYFITVLAGLGFDDIVSWTAQKTAAKPNLSRWIPLAILAVALVEPAWESWQYRNLGLSYYNRLIGGAAGAAANGLEVSYWYEAMTDDHWRRLLDDLPTNSRLFLRPDHPGENLLRQWGVWRPDLQTTGPEDADYWLLYSKWAAYLVPDANGQLVVDPLLKLAQTAPGREIRVNGIRVAVLLPARRPLPPSPTR